MRFGKIGVKTNGLLLYGISQHLGRRVKPATFPWLFNHWLRSALSREEMLRGQDRGAFLAHWIGEGKERNGQRRQPDFWVPVSCAFLSAELDVSGGNVGTENHRGPRSVRDLRVI